MEPRISLITLGVADLARSRAFYEDILGWKAAKGPAEIVFFDLNGVIFALFSHADLAADMGKDTPEPASSTSFALAHNLRSRDEVDALFNTLRDRGVTIDKWPEAAPWGGYSGYFSDPDGHKWEVAFNPFWTICSDGRISLTPPEDAPEGL